MSYLLGLPLDGDAIGPLQEPPTNWKLELAQRFAGIRDDQIEVASEDHGPKVAWLLKYEVSTIFCFGVRVCIFLLLHLCPIVSLLQIGQFIHPMSAPQITRSLEAYILWLLIG